MTPNDIRGAVFLDRDGCISPDELGYNSDPAQYQLYPYTGPALRLLRDLGYLLFVVTNQSGIARGYFDIPALERVHARMRELLSKEGVSLDAVYFSPYFKEGIVPPYNVHHEDRKPGLGMFRRARQEFRFDPGRSWMLGDRYSDIAFGRKAGLKTVLLLSGNGMKEFRNGFAQWEFKPDFTAENLLTAARLIQLLRK
jgi:histidinol-phosphate phosphatase family protein